MKFTFLAAFIAPLPLLLSNAALAASDADVQALRQEMQSIKQSYENRIADLENRLAQLESEKANTSFATISPVSAGGRRIRGNEFNPSIGLILNGEYATFSKDESEFAGFAVGEEGERSNESLSIGESELSLSANVDDKFYGSMTAAIVHEDGEDIIELEEAYLQLLPGVGLPDGASLKAGRALWTFGYLNELHAHADDFADRPLPYRAFLNNAFNDDGIEFSYVLPTDLYAEIGGGVFRGDDFPFGGTTGSGAGVWSAFARIGGDIGYDQAWRIGGYVLNGSADDGRSAVEDEVIFTGDVDLFSADLRYTWNPTGNPRDKELSVQAEYIRRSEDGFYEDMQNATGTVAFDDDADGWYLQTVYKFNPNWRVGLRYSELSSPDVPIGLLDSVLDSGGHDPVAWSLMADWSNSEFSRIRLQFNREELSDGNSDNQLILQYILSLGAHGAHKF